ncbi:Nitrate reductase gamma subunit [Thermincola ferriacetica]|uniref:Nitrate reductase gamma subunit n=1 Tax=Thermincola ferriacetica TaxID=281456 RepID=A0A0L6W0Y7_9FIRM|nr:respiratory nitrate reductase subunit gamma [Thermincola ferriacetica]KNZ69131.1 Nitrate reductase gamma subunit [Thermincola ferriacetica]
MEMNELYYKPWIYFWIVQSLGLLLFASGMAYKISFYFKAQRKSLYKKPDYLIMLRAFLREVLFQKQLAEKSFIRWFAHMAIFYGFMGLLLLSAIAVALETVIPRGSGLSLYMLYGQGHNYYKAAGDLFGLFILTGLVVAFIRRYILRDSQLDTDFYDSVTLVILFVLVLTGFLLEAARIALAEPTPALQYSFFGYQLAGLLRGMPGIKAVATGLWVCHSTLNALLFAYLPHSKLLHIISSPLEIVLNASEERMRSDLYYGDSANTKAAS